MPSYWVVGVEWPEKLIFLGIECPVIQDFLLRLLEWSSKSTSRSKAAIGVYFSKKGILSAPETRSLSGSTLSVKIHRKSDATCRRV